MEKRISLLTQENDILLDNFQKVKDKYQENERTLRSRSHNHDQLYDQMMESQEQLKTLEMNYIELKRMKQILDEKYQVKENEAAKLQQENNEIFSRVNRYENEIKVLRNQIKTLKRANSEFDDKKTQEVQLLTKENERIKSVDKENKNRLIYLERDFEQQMDQNRSLKKELEATKNDCDQMMKMMENYEQRVEHYQKKEEYLTKLTQ